MEEEVPVHDLRILVRRPRIGEVKTLREKSPFTVTKAPEGWEIVVQRVALWEVVEIRGVENGGVENGAAGAS
jgi:hypothetical protein